MGLDTVELVLSVEQAFGISIPADAAASIETVGELSRYISSRIENDMPEEIVFDLLRNILCIQFGVAAERVVFNARIVKDLGLD